MSNARSARVGALALVPLALAAMSVADYGAAQEVDELRGSISRSFGSASWGAATWGALVVSLDAGDTLFAIEPRAALTPASNLKLLTTAAALRALGPEYRFRTYLLTDGEVGGGVVRGDLVLYGTGDPGLSGRFYASRDDVFQGLMDQLEARGIHTITGDLVGDASFFTGPLRPPGWDVRDLNDHFTGAVSALSYNENVVTFRVVAGAVGRRPRVHTIPEHSGLDVRNHAETVEGRARPRLAILRDDPLDPVRVEGRITAGSRDVWREMTVSVPAHFAASSLRAALEERGIALRGRVRVVDRAEESVVRSFSAPAAGRRGARVLARHVSSPLTAYLAVINQESNNLYAELVFRTLGRVSEGVGSTAASSRAVWAELNDLGVDLTGVSQVDGSGLSPGSLVSAATFVDVLERMAQTPEWPDYWASLPEAGARRGLRRMYGTAAAGNLRAKTGTIGGVSALSGMVRSRDGERLAFSLLVNETRSQNRAKRVENQIGALLASFRRAPDHPVRQRLAEALPVESVASKPDRHRVISGENLSVIATRYGVTLGELLRANPRVEADRILSGQWLDIPARGSSE